MSDNMEAKMQNTRIKKNIANIDYEQTLQFFNKRADKYKAESPYSVTMYQDNNPALAEERNKAEVEKLLPLLQIDESSRILDLACGIGRWSDAIQTDIAEYCGIDFSANLIELALKRHQKENRFFYVGTVNEFGEVLRRNRKEKYNRILLMGILIYINDKDLYSVMDQLVQNAEEHAVICIREPVGLEERLTLKEFYSEELKDNYNAIYRTEKELLSIFEKTLMTVGFRMSKRGFLFSEDALNNRKETAQYYFLLER